MIIEVDKKEYMQIKSESKAYKRLMSTFFVSALKDPVTDTIKSFKDTGLYSKEFLTDMESGLRKSSYHK